MSDPKPQVLGFVVKASVHGKKGHQEISQRYTSRDAAGEYKQLAVKSGFSDAFVSEVYGFEKAGLTPIRAKRKAAQPPLVVAA